MIMKVCTNDLQTGSEIKGSGNSCNLDQVVEPIIYPKSIACAKFARAGFDRTTQYTISRLNKIICKVVRLVLAEEGVEYRSRGTDIHANPEQVSPWYVRINPNCNVPTLIHKGNPVVESRGEIQVL